MATSFSVSSSTSQRKYDVFINFYGEDTRHGFADHLYAALKRRGIVVFKDDEKLERGKLIGEELLKAINESRYAIVLISESYANSKWCLTELTQILECREETGLIVLPVFYHVDPSDVRKQKGSFGEAFAEFERYVDEDQRNKWRTALTEVGNLSGWHLRDSFESTVIQEICESIYSGLRLSSSYVSEHLDGQVTEFMTLLCLSMNDVRFIGICWNDRTRKKDLTRVIREKVRRRFHCDFVVVCNGKTSASLVSLQKQLIARIVMKAQGSEDIPVEGRSPEEKQKLEELKGIRNPDEGIKLIQKMKEIRNTKAFIVIEGVDAEAQLDAVVGCRDWFGKGSRVVLTSTDRDLLNISVGNVMVTC